MTDLSLVSSHASGQVEVTVTLSTQVATVSAQDDSRGDTVIMVVTGWLRVGRKLITITEYKACYFIITVKVLVFILFKS